jgi:hypothetical protein
MPHRDIMVSIAGVAKSGRQRLLVSSKCDDQPHERKRPQEDAASPAFHGMAENAAYQPLP